MPKELESPYDLSHSHPKLKELLEKRDKLLSLIAVPLKQGQQSLARLPQGPGSVSVLKIDANDLPSLIVDFDTLWAKLESHDQVIARIQSEKKRYQLAFETPGPRSSGSIVNPNSKRRIYSRCSR